jgi:hypothetical protein
MFMCGNQTWIRVTLVLVKYYSVPNIVRCRYDEIMGKNKIPYAIRVCVTYLGYMCVIVCLPEFFVNGSN